MTDQIVAETIDFVQRRESTVVKQALQAVKALRDSVSLKKELCLPVLAETTEAILELEDQIHCSEAGIAAPAAQSRPTGVVPRGR